MPRPDRNRVAATGPTGYTLVELVVVITILGILGATVGPRFFDQQTFAQRGYADELAAALRYTQKTAVITGCPARLTLALASYAAAQQAAAGNACSAADTTWPTPVLGPDGSSLQGAAPSGTTATPAGVFQFDTQGRLSAAPATTIAVGTRSITIDSLTGFVQVQ